MFKKMTLRSTSLLLLQLSTAISLIVPFVPAYADEHRHEEEHRHHEQEHWHHEFHGRDAHFFDPFELGLWRAGIWQEGWHHGRFGWWWIVNGSWYYYDRPIYPYPYAVSEYVIQEPMVVAPQPYVVAPGAPPTMAPPPPPQQQQPQMWYYCDNPAGYYPYVASCPTPYRAVPAKPQ